MWISLILVLKIKIWDSQKYFKFLHFFWKKNFFLFFLIFFLNFFLYFQLWYVFSFSLTFLANSPLLSLSFSFMFFSFLFFSLLFSSFFYYLRCSLSAILSLILFFFLSLLQKFPVVSMVSTSSTIMVITFSSF